jgi:hypothetical protein
MLPLQLAAGWFNGSFALGAARLLKSRLLAGALRMDPDLVRRQGVGGLLGRVIEVAGAGVAGAGRRAGGAGGRCSSWRWPAGCWLRGAAPLAHALLAGRLAGAGWALLLALVAPAAPGRWRAWR